MALSETQKIELLAQLVAIKSVNGDEEKIAQFLQRYLADYGIKAQLVPVAKGRSCLVAKIGHGHPCLAVSGHLDIVLAEPAEWHSDPFTLTAKKDRLYGRGASDMKAGVAALVSALIALKQANEPKHGSLKLLLTVAEEVGQEGSRVLLEQGYLTDVDALLIAEPTNLELAYAHKGSMDIKVTSRGKSAHSSMPEEGYNALEPLIDFLYQTKQAFEKINQADELLGLASFNATVIKAGKQVNSLPAFAEAKINVRTTPLVDNQKVREILHLWKTKLNHTGAQLDLAIYLDQYPVKLASDSTLLKLACDLGKQYFHQEIKVIGLAPVTDASNLTQGKPTDFPLIIFGPGNKSVHQANEYVDKSQYLTFCELYPQLFTTYLAKN